MTQEHPHVIRHTWRSTALQAQRVETFWGQHRLGHCQMVSLQLRPWQRVAAYGIARDGARVLLVHGGDAGPESPWFLPGGGVEHGEHPRDAVRREFVEETGLIVEVGALLDVMSDVQAHPAEGLLLHSVRVVYRVTMAPQVLPDAPSAGTDVFLWATPQDVARLPLMPFVAKLLATPAPPLSNRT